MSDMGKYTSSSFFLLIKLPRPSGTFILLPSLLHRPSQAPPPQNLPVKRASLPLAVLLATIACAFIASSIGQLAIHIPSAGGMYTYISRSLGARWGFMSAWVFLIAQPLLLPLVAIIWGPYAESLVQTLTGVDIPWYVYSILGIILVFSLTYFGIRISANASMILGAIEITIILALSISMIVAVGTHNDLKTFTLAYSAESGLGGLTG